MGLARSRLVDVFKETFLHEQHLSVLNMHKDDTQILLEMQVPELPL